MENIAPKPELIDLFSEILFQKLKDRKSSILEYTSKQEREIEDIEKKIHLYIQRIGETSSSSIIKNYEKEVEKLEQEKDQILEKIEKSKIGLKNVRTPINEKLKMFRKTLQIWKSGDLETKKFLLRNIFPEGIPIDENRHVRTPILSLVYQAFQV